MKSKLFLALSLLFGVLAAIFWILNIAHNTGAIFPLACNIIQFFFVYKLYKTT